MKRMFVFTIVCITIFGLAGFALATSMWEGHHFNGFKGKLIVNGKEYKKFDIGEWLSCDQKTSGFITLPGDEGTNVYEGVSAESYFTNAGIGEPKVNTLKTIVSAYEMLKAGYEPANPLYNGNPYAFNSTYGSLAQLLIWEVLYDNVLPSSVDAFAQGRFALNDKLPNNMYKEGFQETLDIFLSAMQGANPNAVIFTMHYTVNTAQDSPAILSYGYNPNAVPAPAAVWILGTGLAGMAVMRRKAF